MPLALWFNWFTLTASVPSVPGATLVIWRSLPTAPTDTEATAKFQEYKSYASIEGNLARLSGITQVDISKLDLDQPLEYSDTPGIQGILRISPKPTRPGAGRHARSRTL